MTWGISDTSTVLLLRLLKIQDPDGFSRTPRGAVIHGIPHLVKPRPDLLPVCQSHCQGLQRVFLLSYLERKGVVMKRSGGRRRRPPYLAFRKDSVEEGGSKISPAELWAAILMRNSKQYLVTDRGVRTAACLIGGSLDIST